MASRVRYRAAYGRSRGSRQHNDDDDRAYEDGDDRADSRAQSSYRPEEYDVGPQDSPSRSFYEEGAWSQYRQRHHDADTDWSWSSDQAHRSGVTTWVLWLEPRSGIYRTVLKIGSVDLQTNMARVRFPGSSWQEPFRVDMSSLIPFENSLVDTQAPRRHWTSDIGDWDSDDASVSSFNSHTSRVGFGSQATSVLTRAPPWPRDRNAQPPPRESEKRYRGGAAPQAPAFDGSRDPSAIKLWNKKVRVWQRLSGPYLPPEEQGLRLWEALKGSAQEKVFDRDDEHLYFALDGVDVLLKVIDSIFGQDEMVDLGDRLDAFFEPSRIGRRESESVKDYIDRFETAYQKVTAVGESLSVRSQAQRLMKGMKLDRRDTREMLQLAGGWNYDKLVHHLRIYSQYFAKGAAAPGRDAPSRASSTRSTSSFRSSSSAGGSARSSSSP